MAPISWNRMSSNQRMFAVVLVFTLLTGMAAGGYAVSKSNNEILCLSCLALNPAGGFSGTWWTTYPAGSPVAGERVQHPSMVKNSLGSYDVVVLYFWQHGCSACTEQWEDMKADGLVSGTEENGRMAWKSSQVKLYSLDAKQRGDDFSVYAQYTSRAWATPMTVFVAEDAGEVVWFARMGIMSPRDVRMVIQDAL